MKRSLTYGMITVLLWSTMAPVVKVVLGEIPSLEALTVGSVLAFLFLLVLNCAQGRIRKLRDYRPRQFLAMAGLAVIGLFLYHALYYRGLTELTVQEACIANYMWPVMIVVFSMIILKEKMTFVKGQAMLCSFAGVIILSAGGAGAPGNRLLGLVCCFGAAVLYGLFSVLNKKCDYDQNISMMIFWLVTAVCSAIAGPLTETWVPIRGLQWLGMLWIGIGSNAVAYLLWALALRGVENTAVVANLAYLTPFLSVLLSAIFLKEEIRPRAILALVLIVGGILVQNLWEGKGLRDRNDERSS
ncbi:MAG: DMT family transporter [Lachnospiraceae bacterium]|nr:DMT family transporter [Lachnospiraceae bacterium]